MPLTFQIDGYTIAERRYALAILDSEFPDALQELSTVLREFRIAQDEVLGGGGGEATHTQRLRRALQGIGWKKSRINTKQIVTVEEMAADAVAEQPANYELPSESHEVDHVKQFGDKGTIALEIEWNNKDPFYDRDLENFRRLHQIGLVKVAVIVTRGFGLQDHLRNLFVTHYSDSDRYPSLDDLDVTGKQRAAIRSRIDRGSALGDAAGQVLFANKYGTATTHWDKLIERVDNRLLGHPCPLLLIGIEAGRIDD